MLQKEYEGTDFVCTAIYQPIRASLLVRSSKKVGSLLAHNKWTIDDTLF
jgi:hypothetical protein